jgi:ABC-type lipoprotein release transport system permease subunit
LLGDEVVIRLATQSGAINSSTFVVHGIFYESSFFGFSSYLQREALNTLMAVDSESVNEIGLFLRHPNDMAKVGKDVTTILEKLGHVFPLLLNRQQRDDTLNSGERINGKFLVMTLDAQLAEIHNLIRALWAIGVVLVVLFGVLVVIGISNTYSFLVLERTSEIGTMRAIGMSKAKVLSMFLSESLFLGIIGLSLGLLGGCAILELLRLGFDFSGSDLASLFLVSGRLYWVLEPYHVALISILGLVSVIAGSFRAAWKAAQLSPVDALRQA